MSFGDRSRLPSKSSLSRLDPESDGKESNNGQENSDTQSQESTREWVDDDDSDQDNDKSVSTWSGDIHFTEIQRIDLNKQAQGNLNYCHGQLYYLGSIWDLRSRRHQCDMCWRLWRQTRKNPDVKNGYLTKSRYVLILMELKGRTKRRIEQRGDHVKSGVHIWRFREGFTSFRPTRHPRFDTGPE